MAARAGTARDRQVLSLERKTLDLAGTVFDYGEGQRSGPTLLYLHGFPGTWDQHLRFLELLSSSYHVVACSLPGFGRSGHHDSYSVAAWIEDTRLFITSQFDQPVNGVGYSMGGWFGLGAAVARVDLFSSFVVLDMPLNPADHLDPHRTAMLRAMFRHVVESKSDHDLAERLGSVTLPTGQSYAEVGTFEQRLAHAKDLRQHDPGIYRSIVDAGLDSVLDVPELHALPGEWRGPILFIYGEPDSGSLVNSAGAEFNRERYPWAEEMQFPARGHELGLVEDPEPIAGAIADWVGSLA